MAVARGVSPEAVEAEYADRSGYARFKEDAGSAVAEYLWPIRERYEAIRPTRRSSSRSCARGPKARRSSKTVEIAADRMGLGPGSEAP